jgi:Xrn1 SH3-like domain
MVQASGGVPLSAKDVVIGLNSKSMDVVVWDNPFMSGVTLGDRSVLYQFPFNSFDNFANRCSQYRGSTVEFNTCLNLTTPQFVTSTNPKVQPAYPVSPPNPPFFKPRFGPQPAIRPPPGKAAASGFRPAQFVFILDRGSYRMLTSVIVNPLCTSWLTPIGDEADTRTVEEGLNITVNIVSLQM